MEYGLIGEHLGHSFSKEIHGLLADYQYDLKEISKDSLDSFMRDKDFKGINVTIPYKQDVIKYLNVIDESVDMIGACNTIVNENGILTGYNTDFYGMIALINRMKLQLADKKVLILGSGGTSKTAFAVCKHLKAKDIFKVSRKVSETTIDYNQAYSQHNDANIIINTTPVGMYPNSDNMPIDIKRFNNLEGIVDVIYNPLNTKLVLSGQKESINSQAGLYMLVGQAVIASQKFLNKTYPQEIIEDVYNKILSKKQNIVLIGMPTSGKSTVGKILAKRLGRKLYDVDQEIVNIIKMPISEYFRLYGEEKFRDVESQVVKQLSQLTSSIIATGGGSVLRKENVECLKMNGILYFLDRPLQDLTATSDRPLAKDSNAIKQRYNERYGIYCQCADFIIKADCPVNQVAKKIEGMIK